MLKHKTLTAVAVAMGVAGVLVPGALASPEEDYATIRADWAPDKVITHCKYTLVALQNAQTVSSSTAGDSYTDFPSALEIEIASQKRGDCALAGGGSSGSGGSGNLATFKTNSKLRLAVRPRIVKVGVKTTFRVKVTAPKKTGGRGAVKGAKVRIDGKTARTKSNGRATLKVTFHSTGRKSVRATRKGLKTARIRITVKP